MKLWDLGLPAAKPPAKPPTNYDKAGVEHTLRIDANGQMVLCPRNPNGAAPCKPRKTTLKQLKKVLTGLAKAYPGVKLRIYADAKLLHSVMVQVIQAARDAGISISLAYQPAAGANP